MNKITLNRLTFFENNKITLTCPTFVIEFLAKSSGIKYNFEGSSWKEDSTEIELIIYAIEKYFSDHINTISVEEINNRLRDVALFVNPSPNIQWKNKETLLKAFWSVYNFTPRIPLISTDTFGYKTDDSPFNIDPVMSYIIACRYGIPTKRTTTIEDLNSEILTYSSSLTPLRESILTKLSRFSRRGLIEICSHFKSESPTSGGRKYPSEMAISFEQVAKTFRWDVSNSRYPEEEYRVLDRSSEESYIPFDPTWKDIFNINRRYFHLDFRYIKKYDHLYDNDKKALLIYKNGGSEDTETLVLGIHPGSPPERGPNVMGLTAITMDPVSSDPIERYNNYLSTTDFIVTREELIELWKTAKAFVSPKDVSKEFTESQLKMITLNSDTNHPIITAIKDLQNERLSIVDKGLIYCLEDEMSANIILTKVMALGMSIRGYNICYDKYPLAESSYDIGEYQSRIEEECACRALYLIDNHKNFLKNIPLLTGRNKLGSSNENFSINTFGYGKTLLSAVEDIFNVDSIKSCIRTNSNYFLITSWYYLSKLNKDHPFNIEELRFIS